jgi:hypothetical protein
VLVRLYAPCPRIASAILAREIRGGMSQVCATATGGNNVSAKAQSQHRNGYRRW